MRRINPFAPIGFVDDWLGGGAGGGGLGGGAELGDPDYEGRTADESRPGWSPNPQAFDPFNKYVGVNPYTGMPITDASGDPGTSVAEMMRRLGPLIYQDEEPNTDAFNVPEAAYSRASLAFAIDESTIDSILSNPEDLPSGTGEGTFDGTNLVLDYDTVIDVPKPPSEPLTATDDPVVPASPTESTPPSPPPARDWVVTAPPTRSAVPSEPGSGALAGNAKGGRGPSIPELERRVREDNSSQVTAKNVALGTAHIRIPATSGAYFTPKGVRKTVVNAASSTLISSLDPIGYRHVLKFAGVDVEGLFHINVGEDDDDYSETVGGAAVLISSLILGSVGGATGRALTPADLGLADTDAVVHGTIRVVGNKAIVKVDYLGSVNREIGVRAIRIIPKLAEVARAAGAETLRIETSRALYPPIQKALKFARFQVRGNGTRFKEIVLKP